MRQTSLMAVAVVLLGRISIRQPECGAVIPHNIAHDLGGTAELGLVDNRLMAHKHPVIAIQSFNADAGFIGRNHVGTAQIRNNLGFTGRKR